MKVKLIFAWYDFWIGLFIDQKKKTVYFFPVPMIGLKFHKHEYEYCENKNSMYHTDSKQCIHCGKII